MFAGFELQGDQQCKFQDKDNAVAQSVWIPASWAPVSIGEALESCFGCRMTCPCLTADGTSNMPIRILSDSCHPILYLVSHPADQIALLVQMGPSGSSKTTLLGKSL